MKNPVKLRVPYPVDADAGDGIQIYSDFGSGTIDTTRPLLSKPVPLFPGRHQRFEGYGTEVYGDEVYDTGLASPPAVGGYGDEIYGETPYGESPPYVEIVVYVPALFGSHRFAAELVDSEGNAQGGGLAEISSMVSAEEPPMLSVFSLDGYSIPLDRVTFSVERNVE